ncbi:MAG: Anthranilate synthase component 1 [Phycisphaerae bacterium]|nr:Anthranilate synthase component 1 [Phycisphaerae bacterium]
MSRVYYPSLDEFRRLAAGGNTIPVYCRLLADQLTPVTAYLRIERHAEHAFLLESVVGGENIARYSFLGTSPSAGYLAYGRRVRHTTAGGTREYEHDDPLSDVQKLLAGRRAVHLPGLPRFVGGIVGYAGYDVIRYTEHRLADTAPPDDRRLPDLMFGLYESMVIFDHVSKTINVLCNGHVQGDPDAAYADACRRIDELIGQLNHPIEVGVGEIPEPGRLPAFASNFARADYEAAVEKCKEYIRAGDIFQVVPSQRLTVETRADPFSIYRALRMVNPSPFMFLLKSPQVTLVGASPEIMCRVEDGVVTNRPLAGTRRRGRTDAEDEALARELLADPKERAEHIMLVDLGRNDVGKVAQPGSIELSDVMVVEKYSHVMHICSNVRGRLADGQTAFDALRATLPVGTVSGAPKVRAMEIIDEVEPTRRGPYAGAVGYVDFSGNMDTCIALRTMVIAGGKVYVQAGGGIVADSDPPAEYEETMNKAKALLRAIAIAEAGFGGGRQSGGQ